MSVVLPCWVVTGLRRLVIGRSGRHGRADVLGKQAGVSNTGETQRAPEGSTPLRLREAGRIRMQMRSPTRQPTVRIGLELGILPCSHRDEPQQLGGRHA
jgi:hypothetical protein